MDPDKLISLVRKREGLWDRDDPGHRSMFIQNTLWEEVAREMKSTVKEVRAKWKQLRCAFMGTRNRMRARGRCVDDLKFPDYKSWRRFRRLSFLCKQYRPICNNVKIQPREDDNLRDDETQSGDEESSQCNDSGEDLELCAKEQKMTPGEEFPTSSALPRFTALGLEEEQSTSNANRVDSPPEVKNSLRFAPAGTQGGVLQSLELSKLDGASTVVSDVETEASGSLYLDDRRVALDMEAPWSEQSANCSVQTDVGHTKAHILGPTVEIREDEEEARDEDTSLFRS
jgi:hypothetical protein